MSARCAPRAAVAVAPKARIGGAAPAAVRRNAASASPRRPKLFSAAVEAVEADTSAPEPSAAAAAAADVEITEEGRAANAEPAERRKSTGGGGRGGGGGRRGRRTVTLKTEDIVVGLQVDGKVVRVLLLWYFDIDLSVVAACHRERGQRGGRKKGGMSYPNQFGRGSFFARIERRKSAAVVDMERQKRRTKGKTPYPPSLAHRFAPPPRSRGPVVSSVQKPKPQKLTPSRSKKSFKSF